MRPNAGWQYVFLSLSFKAKQLRKKQNSAVEISSSHQSSISWCSIRSIMSVVYEVQWRAEKLFAIKIVHSRDMDCIEAPTHLGVITGRVDANTTFRAKAISQTRLRSPGRHPRIGAEHLVPGKQLELVSFHEEKPSSRLAAKRAVAAIAACGHVKLSFVFHFLAMAAAVIALVAHKISIPVAFREQHSGMTDAETQLV